MTGSIFSPDNNLGSMLLRFVSGIGFSSNVWFDAEMIESRVPFKLFSPDKRLKNGRTLSIMLSRVGSVDNVDSAEADDWLV